MIANTLERYERPARDEFTELPGSDSEGFDKTNLPGEFSKIGFIERHCVIGPKGITTVLPAEMWYLCLRSDPLVATPSSIIEIPDKDLTDQIYVSDTYGTFTSFFLDEEGQNLHFKKRCGFIQCPCKYYFKIEQ